MKTRHICPNKFVAEGARGGCFFEIEEVEQGSPIVRAGWSCVIVQDGPLPITWLTEIIAIATGHDGGIKGFLEHHNYGGGYALQCDPSGEA